MTAAGAKRISAGAASGLTPSERAGVGREARRDAPRSSHSLLEPVGGRDAVALLEAQALTRIAELVPIRHGRMLTSPFAFFRGAAP